VRRLGYAHPEGASARSIGFLLVGALSLLVVCAQGCGRRGTSERASPNTADTSRGSVGSQNPADPQHPCPPQPAGPQVGRSDPLLNAATPKLGEWSAMWAQALPGFAPDSLWRLSGGRWSPTDVRSFEPVKPGPDVDPGDYLASELLGIRSPNGRYTLDVDYYQVVEPMGDSIEVGGDPDSRCSLIDERKHVEAILLQTGSMAGYHWGAWLSNNSFAVGGWTEADDYGQWMQGQLWLYSLSDSTVSTYATRIISAEVYARYDASWHGWLLKRYRAWKRSRSPA